jgi:two-component system LytT family response regulator
MSNFRVIIVDDERIAREEVKRALAGYEGFEIVGEARNADEAKELIESKKPDLLFLDIQMPGKTGFDLLESLTIVPEVVFTTAFNEFAVQAFDVNALDYLVKPLRAERFAKAMEKAREKLMAATGTGNPMPTNRRIFIKDGNKCHFVNLSEVYLIESMDNYAKIHYSDKVTYIKRSLNQLEEILDAAIFFRISRSRIINAHFIQQIHNLPKGRLQVRLQKGQLLDVSTRQSVKFKSLMRL